eukprot:m.5357 g.5357  ORF g.5357 m.5357 type:complete len:949 (-) comp3283_c0_seq1:19-2865(-)
MHKTNISVKLSYFCILFTFLFLHQKVVSLDNGLARKPPLGWSSWLGLGFRDFCNDTTIREAADAMVSSGLQAHGYTTLMISDCWAGTKRSESPGPNGEPAQYLAPDPDLFPNGMKPVVDYAHEKGLKVGLYTCIGTMTCVGNRPALGWPCKGGDAPLPCAEIDALTYKVWGIDWVKIDNCNNRQDPRLVYKTFATIQNATNHAMLINLCEWGEDDPWTGWAAAAGNSYRVYGDHCDSWATNGNGPSPPSPPHPPGPVPTVANETGLVLGVCDTSDSSMLFSLDNSSAILRNQGDGKVLSAKGCSASADAAILFPYYPFTNDFSKWEENLGCPGGSNQHWSITTSQVTSTVSFRSKLSNTCLTSVPSTHATNVASLKLSRCSSSDTSQQWHMTDTGAGLQFVSISSGRCLQASKPTDNIYQEGPSCRGARGTDEIIQHQIGKSAYTGRPGAWNDLDMVMTGLAFQPQAIGHYFPGQSEDEYITEFSFWALLQSPLVWTGDVRNMTAFQKKVLFNQAVLNVNQDVCPGKKQGDLVYAPQDNSYQVWSTRMCNGSLAVILYNRQNNASMISANFSLFGNYSSQTKGLISDLWTGEQTTRVGSISGLVPKHGVLFAMVSFDEGALSFKLLPRFTHCFNESGLFPPNVASLFASSQLVAFGNAQGIKTPPVNASAEKKICAAGKEMKSVNPTVPVMLYLPNGPYAWYDIGAWFLDNPEYMLHDKNGNILKAYDLSSNTARQRLIDNLMVYVHSGCIDGIFIDGGDPDSAEHISSNCTTAKQEEYIAGNKLYHKELRKALGPKGPIITLGGSWDGDTGSLYGLLFLSSTPYIPDIIKTLTQMNNLTIGEHLAVEYVHDGSNFPLALATFLVGYQDAMYFHSPQTQLENFDLWSCDGWVNEMKEWKLPLGDPKSSNYTTNATHVFREYTSGTIASVNMVNGVGCVMWASDHVTGC